MDKYKFRSIRQAKTLEDKMFILLGDDWGGVPNPPGQLTRVTYADTDGIEYVFSYRGNDGFELGIGYPEKWLTHLSQRAARRLWWAITKNHLSTWFGVRRWLWYKLLSRQVNRHVARVASEPLYG